MLARKTIILAATATMVVTGAAANASEPLAPLYTSSDDIARQYVVVLKKTATQAMLAGPLETARDAGGTIRREFRGGALTGFSANLPGAAVTELRRDPAVAYVQGNRIHRQPNTVASSQPETPWNLDRIDQRDLPLDQSYDPPRDGSGATVYVLDTGIRATHTEFEGRAEGVYSSVGDSTDDCHGHGTMVASHVAGKTYGVARQAEIAAVRILDCDNSGTTEQIVDGMDWTAANAPASSVVNMSIQSSNGVADQAMDDAAAGMIDKGLLLVLIAGNFGKGDCENSPKDPRAVIMGNSNRQDQRHTGDSASSYGPCVTAFAPGTNVSGAGIDSDTDTISGWTGTSFAAPLAAGQIAQQVQQNPGLTMDQAKKTIIDTATTGRLSEIGAGSPNRLLYVGTGSADTEGSTG